MHSATLAPVTSQGFCPTDGDPNDSALGALPSDAKLKARLR